MDFVYVVKWLHFIGVYFVHFHLYSNILAFWVFATTVFLLLGGLFFWYHSIKQILWSFINFLLSLTFLCRVLECSTWVCHENRNNNNNNEWIIWYLSGLLSICHIVSEGKWTCGLISVIILQVSVREDSIFIWQHQEICYFACLYGCYAANDCTICIHIWKRFQTTFLCVFTCVLCRINPSISDCQPNNPAHNRYMKSRVDLYQTTFKTCMFVLWLYVNKPKVT